MWSSQSFITDCVAWMLVSPKFIGRNLITIMMVFRGAVIGTWLSQEGRAPTDVTSSLRQETILPLRSEDTGRRWPSVDQEVGPHWTQIGQAPRSWGPSLQNCEKRLSLTSHPACGTYSVIAAPTHVHWPHFPPASWPSLCPWLYHALSGESIDSHLPLFGLFSADIFLSLVF